MWAVNVPGCYTQYFDRLVTDTSCSEVEPLQNCVYFGEYGADGGLLLQK